MNGTGKTSLDQLLQRGDIWRGNSNASSQHPTLDSGHPMLNQQLCNGGWPCGCMVEICQPAPGHGDWLLFMPSLRQQLLDNPGSHAVLLNPPALPFCQGLLQADLPLQQLLLVRIQHKADFIASLVELAHADCCRLLLAWQPKQALNYSELRKCQLACAAGNGLYVLFRHQRSLQQSSPAALRLQVQLTQQTLSITFLKQRGQLTPPQPVELPLPGYWQAMPPHRLLGAPLLAPSAANDRRFTGYQPQQNLLPLRTGVAGRVHLKSAN